jgi:hypothetical protein
VFCQLEIFPEVLFIYLFIYFLLAKEKSKPMECFRKNQSRRTMGSAIT